MSRKDNVAADKALQSTGLLCFSRRMKNVASGTPWRMKANLKLKANAYVSAEMFDELMTLLGEYRSGSVTEP